MTTVLQFAPCCDRMNIKDYRTKRSLANIMIEGTQMTFDFLTSVNQTDTTALDAHNNTHGYDMAQVSPFPFEQLFIDAIDAEEIHNHNSMAVCGDSLQIMKQMKNGSVKLIFADAPYNIGKDFGNNSDKWETVQQYTDWCKLWIDECLRVLSDDGTMYFMTATQHMPYLDIYVSEKYNVLCRIVWTYDSSGVQSKKMFGSLYEPKLLERIIKASSNEGDIVFDPFAGSFTTSAVAVRLGRIGIGIDLNREYFEMGIRRTGISNEYNGKLLVKNKVRKTNAKSKYVREKYMKIK